MSNWDVFISYSSIDNMDGWVDKFQARLDTELSGELGRKAEIFQYEKDQPGFAVELMPHIVENIRKSTVMISILSPAYKNSTICKEEFRTFKEQKSAENIIAVAKKPIEYDEMMVVSYKFYRDDRKQKNIENQITQSIKIDPDNDKKEFNNIIEKLSIKIARFFEGLKQDEDSPLIYLAEPSPDMADEYKKIKLDLKQRKCNFIPIEINPFKQPDPEKFRDEIRKDIQQCKLAVQIIGEQNSLYPQGSLESYLQLQNEVAAERDGEESDLKRLIWLPKYNVKDDAEPEDFIKQVLAIPSKNIEIIQNPSIEYFKGQIQDNLESVKPKIEPPITIPPMDLPFVYLLYDRSDSKTADRLRKSIHQKTGFGIWGSDEYFDSSLKGSERTESHDFLLQTCKFVLIYWRQASPRWLFQSISEVLRATAKRGKEAHKAIFIDNETSRFIPPGDLLPINGYPELQKFFSLLEVKN